MRLCRDDLRRRAVAVTPRVVMAYGRSLRRLVAGVAVGAGTAAGVAVYPLFTREPPSASSEASWWHDAFQGSRVGAAAMVAARLLRDAVTIALVSREYSTALAGGMTDLSTVHRAGAARILRLCQVNQGVYVKFGQHITQLEHLLPVEYVRAMEPMLKEAPQSSWSEVERTLRSELGDLSVVFTSIERVPIASASLAQVHMGILRSSGERVAVKVQHAGLLETAPADIWTIQMLVNAVRRRFPRFDYQWLVDEVRTNLPRELDFVLEGKNAEECAHLFSDRSDIAVPRIVWPASGRRVLTMSFEEGVHIDNRDAIAKMGLSPAAVARVVSEAFCEMIFKAGVVHCDPHAGNVLVRALPGSKSGVQIVLLDHGLYRRLSTQFRLDYCGLWRAIILSDEHALQKYSSRMGAGDMHKLFASILTARTWDAMSDLLANPGDVEKPVARANAQKYSAEIGDILASCPRELLLMLKTNDCLRTIDTVLGVPINSYSVAARYCVEGQHEADIRDGKPWLRRTASWWADRITVAVSFSVLQKILAVSSWRSSRIAT